MSKVLTAGTVRITSDSRYSVLHDKGKFLNSLEQRVLSTTCPFLGSDFVRLIFIENFQTFLEVKIKINLVNLTP